MRTKNSPSENMRSLARKKVKIELSAIKVNKIAEDDEEDK